MADKETWFWVCCNGETENVRMALTRGEDFKGFGHLGYSAITLAASRGHLDVVAVLLEQGGVDVNSTDEFGYTALHRAASNGHAPVVQLLISKPGIAVNQADDFGNTALHAACMHGGNNCPRGMYGGHLAVIELLLTNMDVDPNAKNRGGRTPIMLLLLTNSNHSNVKECLRVMVESERVDILYVKDRQGRGLEDLAR